MKLSIIIPVYNEEKTLRKIVDKLQRVNLGNVSKELVIVNDSSKDRSGEIITELKRDYKNIKSYTHPKNMGKGAALRTGLKHVTGEITTIQDGDLEYNPEDYKKLIEPIISGKENVVYGSRFLEAHSPRYKMYYFGNIFLSFVTRILYKTRITDMETCYKVIRTKLFQRLNLVSNKFDIEPEITSKLLKRGETILEKPISYSSRSFEEGKKINWKDGVRAIYVLFYWKFKQS